MRNKIVLKLELSPKKEAPSVFGVRCVHEKNRKTSPYKVVMRMLKSNKSNNLLDLSSKNVLNLNNWLFPSTNVPNKW